MDGIPGDAFSSPQSVPDGNLKAQVEAFQQRLRDDDDLQRQLRMVTSSAGIAEVLEAAGFRFSAAQLVKHFARRLLDADDALALRKFDNFGWDQGELAWLLKTWE